MIASGRVQRVDQVTVEVTALDGSTIQRVQADAFKWIAVGDDVDVDMSGPQPRIVRHWSGRRPGPDDDVRRRG
jgi:hypothetical protein